MTELAMAEALSRYPRESYYIADKFPAISSGSSSRARTGQFLTELKTAYIFRIQNRYDQGLPHFLMRQPHS